MSNERSLNPLSNTIRFAYFQTCIRKIYPFEVGLLKKGMSYENMKGILVFTLPNQLKMNFSNILGASLIWVSFLKSTLA